MANLNCWEFTRCGREPGGAKVAQLGVCDATRETAAHGLNRGHNGGRACWAVAGTLCGGAIQGSSATKLGSCVQCRFFQAVRGEEGAAFDCGAAFIAEHTARESLKEAFENLIASNIKQQELQAGMAHVERLVATGELAAGVAHEINNPLAFVIANLTHLARELPEVFDQLRAQASGLTPAPGDPLGPEALEDLLQALAEAREGADRVKLVVRDLKSLSRVDEAERGEVDVRRVVEGSIRLVRNEIRQRARLVTDFVEVPRIVANEARQGQVFLNLAMNAAQAIPEGAAEQNELRISTSVDDEGRVVVDVTDTGVGIPPHLLSRIFEPFFTTKPVGLGTGLGLSICETIVSALGGSLAVESEVGKGTTFRVTLPPSRSLTAATAGAEPDAFRAPQ